MARHLSPIFQGFCGSVNNLLVFKQVHGQTIVTVFPDRSKVIFSERQKQAQKRFSDAVYFARTIIGNTNLKKIYALKASLHNFRSAWNAAIAEYMGDAPLSFKPVKERFDQRIITNQMGTDIHVKLVKHIPADYSNSGIKSGVAPLLQKRLSAAIRQNKLRAWTVPVEEYLRAST
jgi:hypothetical protein